MKEVDGVKLGGEKQHANSGLINKPSCHAAKPFLVSAKALEMEKA